MVHEDQIRDLLAADIAFIERGLVLIAKNYRLENQDGSYGYIDLLARDSAGTFVVIELKRSRQASRQALHEISKYVELLSRSRGVPLREIRAMIISTDWNELLVPFSHWHARCDYQLTGIQLGLKSDRLTPEDIKIIEPLVPVTERGLTPVQGLISISDPRGLEDIWMDVVSRLRQVGCDDVLGVVLRDSSRAAIILYIALGRMSRNDPRTHHLDHWEIPEDSVEAPEGCHVEYAALCELSLAQYEGWSGSHPEKFVALTEQYGWRASILLREGAFTAQEDLYSDEQLLRMISGDAGDGQVRLQLRSRPLNKPHWTKFLSQTSKGLIGAPGWQEILPEWLAERAVDASEFDIVFHLYNPADFISCLVHARQRPDLIARIFPRLEAVVDAPMPHHRELLGFLSWDGKQRDVTALFREAYPRDDEWAMARVTGSVWDIDQRLMKKWGLTYVVVEFSNRYLGGALLIAHDGVLVRVPFAKDSEGNPVLTGIGRLENFLGTYQTQLHDLVDRLDSKRVWPGGGSTTA
ncbi:endonuclease NucS domain-containing protein [Arthrobacter sp. AD-310]